MNIKKTLILEKRFDNEILLINPNTKIINKKKANNKNPFYIKILPFSEKIRYKKTGLIIMKSNSLSNSLNNHLQSVYLNYYNSFNKKIKKSNLIDNLSFYNVSLEKCVSFNKNNIFDFNTINSIAVDTALENISDLKWKNCFIFIPSSLNPNYSFPNN